MWWAAARGHRINIHYEKEKKSLRREVWVHRKPFGKKATNLRGEGSSTKADSVASQVGRCLSLRFWCRSMEDQSVEVVYAAQSSGG
jgi:hypothetical protein